MKMVNFIFYQNRCLKSFHAFSISPEFQFISKKNNFQKYINLFTVEIEFHSTVFRGISSVHNMSRLFIYSILDLDLSCCGKIRQSKICEFVKRSNIDILQHLT